ncbi:flagellar export chaperone FliS [Cedecea sp.]|jgi:flagellar protein FliS|uniref:flagellar export chaperone FliS n=1 Tax=Cedecea sp. TaxID=1970739 RepID=UPI002F425DCA
MYSNSGVQAYQSVGLETAVLSASPHQLVVILFDGALSALIRARLFIEQNETAAKGQAITRAINIIDNGLKAGLNMEVGGELPHNLSALYEYMVQRLLQANLYNDISIINEVEALLNNIASAWKQIGPGTSPTQDSF